METELFKILDSMTLVEYLYCKYLHCSKFYNGAQLKDSNLSPKIIEHELALLQFEYYGNNMANDSWNPSFFYMISNFFTYRGFRGDTIHGSPIRAVVEDYFVAKTQSLTSHISMRLAEVEYEIEHSNITIKKEHKSIMRAIRQIEIRQIPIPLEMCNLIDEYMVNF